MNTLLVFLSWAGVQQSISIIAVLVIYFAGFVLYYFFFIYPRQRAKIVASKEQLLPKRDVDFPKPLCVEVIKPDERDPDRMIWSLPDDYVWDGLAMSLQKYLDSKLNPQLNLSVKVYIRPNGGAWINFRKKKEADWEDTFIHGEEHLQIFFDKNIEFYKKKLEQITSG